jgi:large subunit ribosomal protein L4
MDAARYQQDGTKSGAVTLPEVAFAQPTNTDLLHQTVKTLQHRERRVLAHTKTRGEVRGGGKKPWRQKGTGRARHGSSRSPIWRSGGVTFGPRRDRNFSLTLPKQMRRRSLALALSEKARAEQIAVLESLNLQEVKTKFFAAAMTAVANSAFGEGAAKKSLLLVTSEYNPALARASRNLKNVSLVSAAAVNALDILSAQYLLVTEDALAVLAGRTTKEGSGDKAKATSAKTETPKAEKSEADAVSAKKATTAKPARPGKTPAKASAAKKPSPAKKQTS